LSKGFDAPGQRQSARRLAILFDQAGDVVTPKPAARLALDRQGRDAKVREGVGVVSHASGGLSLMRVVWLAEG
jgi:hypothetical protein